MGQNENGECHKGCQECANGTAKRKKTPKVFEVSGATVKDKVNGKETGTEELINTRLGRKTVLACSPNEVLVRYCLTMVRKCLGLTTSNLSKLSN